MYQIQFQNLMAANYLQQTMAGRGQTTQSSLLTTTTPTMNNNNNNNVISAASDSTNVNTKRKLLANKKFNDQQQDNYDNHYDQSQDNNDNDSDNEKQHQKFKKANRTSGNGKVDHDLIKLNKKNKSKPSTIHHNHVY